MFQDGLFKGKKILVTGGGTGLGRGMAQRLLILGAEIAICGRRKGVCDETVEALMKAHGGVVKAYGVDIRDAPAVEAMIDEIFRDASAGPRPKCARSARRTSPRSRRRE
ncbi:MAG TPA: SDR family NAD(P)-dependent oxidoreductase [Acetobacteraceae bacterium]|nr:SDR family NAD(P)-dependent oxidoreductase [Acetobacteraceae bacterium]